MSVNNAVIHEVPKKCGHCIKFLAKGFCSEYFNSLKAFGNVHVTRDHVSCSFFCSFMENKKFKLMVSHNLGATYLLDYQTDDVDDQNLIEKIKHYNENLIRYYVESNGQVSQVSDIHKKTVSLLGGNADDIVESNCYAKSSIEDMVIKLKNKFGK